MAELTKADLQAALKEAGAQLERRLLAKMATKDELKEALAHQTDILERKIERSQIELKAEMYKQRLEIESSTRRYTDDLANSFKKQADNVESRLTALEVAH